MQERALRRDVTFPLVAYFDGEQICGTCENLSESGLLGAFSKELSVWTIGEIDLHLGTGLIGVRVRVARSIGLHAGLTFLPEKEDERQRIRDLVKSVRQGVKLPEHPELT